MNKDHCALPSCGKELTHTEGRRKKKYCGASCKMKHWAERNKNYVPVTKHIKFEEWEKIQKKIAENNKPENKAKIEAERNGVEKNDDIRKYPVSESEAIPPPKTIDQLKAMCPTELEQFERSQWIREKRVEYGI